METQAHSLLHGHRISANGATYALVEIEAYRHSASHSDPFTHRHSEQAATGWYFHRQGKAYRGGTRKGLDVCFGTPGVYDAFLIRAIRRKNGSLVEGPSLVVDEILSAFNRTSIKDLVDLDLKGNMDCSSGVFKLIKLDEPVECKIYVSPRVGLLINQFHKNVFERLHFVAKRYRWYTEKLKKGSVQCVIGLLDDKTLKNSELKSHCASTSSKIESTINSYKEGKQFTLSLLFPNETEKKTNDDVEKSPEPGTKRKHFSIFDPPKKSLKLDSPDSSSSVSDTPPMATTYLKKFNESNTPSMSSLTQIAWTIADLSQGKDLALFYGAVDAWNEIVENEGLVLT